MDDSAQRPTMLSTEAIVQVGARIDLRDGSPIRIRRLRSSDHELLSRGFGRLSADSRYKRFLRPLPKLPESMARYFIEIDHHDHEAIVAIDERSGEGVGVARYVRNAARPEAAELAVTVIDDWQGRGVGTLLAEAISMRAREEGITTFTALMLADNQEMMDLLRQLGTVRVVDSAAGTVEVEVPITGRFEIGPQLRRLLRIAAVTDTAVPSFAFWSADPRP